MEKEEELIQRCKDGDMEAFNTLYKKYSVKALRTAYLITGKKDIAEDIVQEAFIQCYKQIKNLKKVETFPAWFYKLLTRISWRYCSNEKKEVHIDNLSEDYNFQIKDEYVLNDIVEKNEIKKLVNNALNKLSIPLKTTVVLYYFNEMSVREISKVLGCFEGTVKSRLFNARKLLEKEFMNVQYENYFEMENFHKKECNLNVKAKTI